MNVPPPPSLSVVLLTKDEEPNVADAVTSLLAQDGPPLEVLVVDSASEDRTVEIAERLAASDARVRVFTSSRNLAIGEARNLGLREARAPVVAFMSADATAAPGWSRALLAALERGADVVYGRQEHAPVALTVGGVVRGIRYHHFDLADRLPPETFASNVNAGIRREVFERVRYVDEGPASALDDVLFTREAMALGHRVAYEPAMLVRHKDAATVKGELKKNRREGYGWGLLAPRLGYHRVVLAWGGALAFSLALAAALPSAPTAFLALGVLYAPALRRAAAAGRRYLRAPATLAAAVAVSPLFDLAFLSSYLRGLRDRRADLTGVVRPHGA